MTFDLDTLIQIATVGSATYISTSFVLYSLRRIEAKKPQLRLAPATGILTIFDPNSSISKDRAVEILFSVISMIAIAFVLLFPSAIEDNNQYQLTSSTLSLQPYQSSQEEINTVDVVAQTIVEDPRIELESMTVKQLRGVCKEKHISLPKGYVKKDALINMLLTA